MMKWKSMTDGWKGKSSKKQESVEERYYISDANGEGDNVMFRCDDGYDEDISKAKTFSKAEATEIHNEERADVPYLVDKVNDVAVRKAYKDRIGKALSDAELESFDGDTHCICNVAGEKYALFMNRDDNGWNRSCEYDKAFVFNRINNNELDKNQIDTLKGIWYRFYKKDDIDIINVLNVEDVYRRVMCRGINVKRLKRNRKVDKYKNKCIECGKIVWNYKHKEKIRCRICSEMNVSK